MTDTLWVTDTLEVTNCTCGVRFAVPQSFLNKRREDGKGFFCPNGHRLSYHETEAMRLRKEKAKLEARIARADAANVHLRDQRDASERSRAAYKGQVTKIRNRVANGVCPACHRSFSDLHDHMATKHPNYAEADR